MIPTFQLKVDDYDGEDGEEEENEEEEEEEEGEGSSSKPDSINSFVQKSVQEAIQSSGQESNPDILEKRPSQKQDLKESFKPAIVPQFEGLSPPKTNAERVLREANEHLRENIARKKMRAYEMTDRSLKASATLQNGTVQTSQNVVNNLVSLREYATLLNDRSSAMTKNILES